MSLHQDPRPIAFSVAGFKALPFDHPPVLPLEGVVVLMGTNSSGKSSLLLALRLFVTSLLQEPELERLHLRLPELPQPRVASSLDLVDETRLAAHMARFTEATGLKAHRELTFRVRFSDGIVLESRFEVPAPPARFYDNQPDPSPADPLARSVLQPSTLRLAPSSQPLRLLRQDHGQARNDLWGNLAVVNANPDEFLRRLSALRTWASRFGFLDSIRSEPVPGTTPEGMMRTIDSPAVAPDGRNSTALLAATEVGEFGYQLEVAEDDRVLGTESPKFLPAAIHPLLLVDPSCGRTPGPVQVVSHLMEWCGLEPIGLFQEAPGLTSDLRRRGTSLTLSQLGDGQRQVLPVLTQALFSHEGTSMSWEHPDLHLHPGAATALGRLACRLAATGRTVLIETHSYDLVHGVRTEAATLRIEQVRGRPCALAPAHARLVYLHRTDEGIRWETYDLNDPDSDIPLWPGFVAESVRERQQFQDSLLAQQAFPTDEDVAHLLQQGEGQHVEFKASLSFNLEAQRSDTEVTFHALRAIASFCNDRSGGFLLLGVDDRGHVVGLDKNIQDWDLFQQHLANVVSRTFEPDFFGEHLRVSRHEVDGVPFAVVRCLPAQRPVALRHTKLQRDVYLVRAGNTSRTLELAQVPQWIARRFPT